MYSILTEGRIATGQSMQIGRVEMPDDKWGPLLLTFLEHKSDEWLNHLKLAFSQNMPGLVTNCYVGVVEGNTACHIMMSVSGNAAILGHVYTHPNHRRKGAIRVLMEAVIGDCCKRNVEIITLGTSYGTPAYAIYEHFGFRSAVPRGGSMLLELKAGAVASSLRSAAACIRDLGWRDWPWLTLVGMLPGAPEDNAPRSLAMGLEGPGNVEGGFLQFMLAGPPPGTAIALVSSAGPTVGWATLTRAVNGDPRIDLYATPAFAKYYGDLRAALNSSSRAVTS